MGVKLAKARWYSKTYTMPMTKQTAGQVLDSEHRLLVQVCPGSDNEVEKLTDAIRNLPDIITLAEDVMRDNSPNSESVIRLKALINSYK